MEKFYFVKLKALPTNGEYYKCPLFHLSKTMEVLMFRDKETLPGCCLGIKIHITILDLSKTFERQSYWCIDTTCGEHMFCTRLMSF